ncbi:chemotaxis protein CheD [candidate division TA06 bacterium]|uniref:Probable chemoreceptor glutamine deamidase CheD n=1 Tax=candidate division TA06 bacterium TaxID=2250710 RepID=A0A660SLS1_UNCT6|nr:MAG: chemotaxis protein CheD [candidate division TA06 bacterium]
MKKTAHIGEFIIAKNPSILITNGLGSCIAVALYDKKNKSGGLLHFLLPDSSLSVDVSNPAKFADMGIDQLVYQLVENGSNINNLCAKIIGGANMFSQLPRHALKPIGERNIASARLNLERQGIPIISEDVGANYGRSIEFHLDTGIVIVKSYKMGKLRL